MKIIYALGIAQFAAILFLTDKMISLEHEIQSLSNESHAALQIASAKADTASHPNTDELRQENDNASSIDEPMNNARSLQSKSPQSISLQSIRKLVREEITTAMAHLPANNAAAPNAIERLANLPDNPQQVDKLRTQLDVFMSDGEFTADELNQVESSLATMNYDDRKSVLKKMAQAMNRANVNFTH